MVDETWESATDVNEAKEPAAFMNGIMKPTTRSK